MSMICVFSDEPDVAVVAEEETNRKRKADDTDENSQDDAAKKAKSDEGSSQKGQDEDDDDDGAFCPICFEPWTNSGDHRIASLKCGHFFGQACIDR